MSVGTQYNQLDIVLMPFPFSDLTGSKKRPAIIISNKEINSGEDRICCMVTSKKPNVGIKIKSEDVSKGKLPLESWIKPHRIFIAEKRIIQKRVCKISAKLHKKIVKEINNFLL